MPDIVRIYHRQDLLQLQPAAELECQPTDLKEIRAWLAAGFPVIVCRPGTTAAGIHCGIPLPPAMGRKRIALRVSQKAVLAQRSLPRLKECLAGLAQSFWPVSDSLLAWNPEVFGSLAWQHLTGLQYLHAKSDLDLLFRVRNPEEWQLLRTNPVLRDNPFCDPEILLCRQHAFSWREFCTADASLLVKTDQQVFLLPKRLLMDASPDSECIAAAAVDALREELEAYPKPGLVSFLDNGSHKDMQASHFMAAIAVLPEFFQQLAEAGSEQAAFPALQQIGRAAEQKMLIATGGVNTHRGAIFSLGLLAAAAGWKFHSGSRLRLGEIVRKHWGDGILQSRNPGSHGAEVLRKYGIRGAAAEAAAGFPAVYQYGLPALCSLPERNAARIQAFFALLEKVPDTTLLYRGGREGLQFATTAAVEFKRGGGSMAPGWEQKAAALHQKFIRRGLSCGGIADLLSATIFIQQMEGIWQD